MNRIKFSVRPVTGKQGILVLGWKLGSVTKDDPGGRAEPDVNSCAKRVAAGVHEFSRTRSPAVVGTVDHMVDSSRTVPRSIEIPFHVGIVGE